MKRITLTTFYISTIFVFIAIVFSSCTHNQNLITEEIIAKKQQIERKDSLVKEAKQLNRLGSEARNKANYQEALNYHYRALNLSEMANDTIGQLYALNNIGTDLRRTYSNIEASSYHYLALDLSDKNNSAHSKHRARAMNGLGNILLVLNKPNQAIGYFERALKNEQQHKSDLGEAINYANIAEAYNRMNKPDSALLFYDKSLTKNIELDSNIGIAICKRAMGEIYYDKNQPNRALTLLNEAFELMKDSKDAFHKLEVQITLAQTFINLNRLQQAEEHIEAILSLAKQLNSHEYQQRGYELLAELKEQQQQYKAAYDAKEKAFLYRDSVMAINNEVRILELENRYKGKEAAQQIQLLTTEKVLSEKTKIAQQRIFFLLILMLVIFIGFLYYRYKSKLKISRELENINKIKSKFFGNISHEFRTPLTLIKGPIGKWLEHDLTPEMEKDARVVLRNAERLLFLVDQLLGLSKVDSGNFKINPHLADLSLALRGIANYFLHIAKEKSINYHISIDSSGKEWVDLDIIEIIVTNLLSNALKYTNEHGNITFVGEKSKEGYQVRIANSGERLSEEDLSRIFDRFYTNDVSHYRSTGIGLALVKELCTLYDAALSVQYNEDDEIEFTVLFPPLQPGEASVNEDLALENIRVDRFQMTREGSPEAIAAAKESEEETKKMVSEKPLLLVVEDNEDLRTYVVDSFRDVCDTIEAQDGEQGIALAKEHIPDIIITDIMMPKVNGLQLCETIKGDTSTNHIPVIILTALNEEREMLAGLKSKADDYVTKPFGANMLKQKVKNLLELRSMLSEKYRKELIIKPLNLLITDGEDTFANTLKEVIENEITDPDFGVDEFCSVAAMSRSQLYRKLKATVGMSVSEFIRVHRVKLASELLKNKNHNVTDVCFASGFKDASYFSKSFKEVFGVPPAVYRKQLHKNEDD